MLNLYELLDVIGESMNVKIINNQFIVTLQDCEIKDYKKSPIIGPCPSEVGNTIGEAADKLFKSIRGKWLVFDSLNIKQGRREFSATIYQKVLDNKIV